jgi:hypothetical protein
MLHVQENESGGDSELKASEILENWFGTFRLGGWRNGVIEPSEKNEAAFALKLEKAILALENKDPTPRCPRCPPVEFRFRIKGVSHVVESRGPELRIFEHNYSGTGADIADCPECRTSFYISYEIESITLAQEAEPLLETFHCCKHCRASKRGSGIGCSREGEGHDEPCEDCKAGEEGKVRR